MGSLDETALYGKVQSEKFEAEANDNVAKLKAFSVSCARRENQCEYGSLVIAFREHVPSMQVHDRPHDGEAQPAGVH